MKNLDKFQVAELTDKEIIKTDGGFLLGSSGFNWGNFWNGVGIGAGIGGTVYIAQEYA